MAITSRQIGWSQESNILWSISKQLEQIARLGGGGSGTVTGGGVNGQIAFWDAATNITGSNNLFWDNINKRMGIGTNTPLTTAANYTVLALNNIIGGVLEFQSNGTRIATINNNSLQLDIETKIAGPITFGTNGSERMRVDSAGNVGIGTTTPVGKLDVTSDGGGQMFFSRYGGQPQINIRRAQGTFAVPTAVPFGASSVLNFQNYNGTAFATSAQIQSVPTTQSATDAGATLALNVVQGLTTTLTNGLIVSGNNSTAGSISITNAFNAPSARLTIWQSTLNTTLDYFDIVTSGGGQLLRFFNTGNLTVGSGADATYRLDVNGTSRFQSNVLIKGSTSNSSASALTVQNSSNNGLFTVRNDGAVFIEAPSGTAALYMSNVGSTRFEKSTGGIICLGPGTSAHSFSISSFDSNNYGNGALSSLNFNGNFTGINGSTAFSYMLINGTINQTGTNTSITRGLYVNPTLTLATDFRAIETARGNIVFSNLPTSSAGLPTGALWNNGGVVNIV